MNTTSKLVNIPHWQNLSLENLPNEIWLPLKKSEVNYEISNMGRLKCLNYLHHKGKIKIAKPIIINSGYLKFSIYIDGVCKQLLNHRLVADHFIKNPENKRTVNHINGIKTDNRVENLEWNTHFENIEHSANVLGLNKEFQPVIQLGLDYIFIKKWRSISHIQQVTGYSKSNISKHLKGHKRYKTAYKFIWMLEDEYLSTYQTNL